ncbi:hypothetical protein [Bradyrhizobium cenepequi]|uniref:hypothetical protein n=1 Tax=Bradyrhizobium cenepequi TaxID=2821403 RepID=UPI001CE3ADCA|nr:hypothetical protein [Bradyrhizobium cenepequi]MCA6108573.1 hypothetical protein [Bradyrhizobium cenepequi]
MSAEGDAPEAGAPELALVETQNYLANRGGRPVGVVVIKRIDGSSYARALDWPNLDKSKLRAESERLKVEGRVIAEAVKQGPAKIEGSNLHITACETTYIGGVTQTDAGVPKGS